MQIKNKHRNSFTLIELLVVLALVAILSVVVVLTLNPAELIKQARDSNRLSDLSTINTALNLFSADVTSGFMGTSTVVYVSVPSVSPTCSGLGLPTLPSGYTYNCVTATSTRNTNGTGWIPVNFQRISSNSPISQLPVDPINTTSTRLYYTYISGGSWELNAAIEASKNKLGGSGDLVSKDGGSAASQYEIGNNLNLNPIETGDASLVGYWNFEEGPNTTSSDRSGYGNHGTWYGTSTQSEHYSVGKVGSYSGYFNGSGDRVSMGNPGGVLNFGLGSFTISGWFRTSSSGSMQIVSKYSGVPLYYVRVATGVFNSRIRTATFNPGDITGGSGASNNQWQYFVAVFNRAGSINNYLNAVLSGQADISPGSQETSDNTNSLVIGADQGATLNFSGYIDDVRIYNRALSSAEISALYNATK